MVEEVLPRLRMLKRQTVKWEKRAQVEAELKNLEDGYFSFKFGEIERTGGNWNRVEKIAEVIVEKILN